MPYKNPSKYKDYIKKWRENNPDKIRKYLKKYHKKVQQKVQYIRMQIFERYGKVCKKCGFSDIRALQIDHVLGDGNIERSKTKWAFGTATYYRKVLADKTGKYQILCANCNCIKRIENNEMNLSGLKT